jgi:hypothetical protein
MMEAAPHFLRTVPFPIILFLLPRSPKASVRLRTPRVPPPLSTVKRPVPVFLFVLERLVRVREPADEVLCEASVVCRRAVGAFKGEEGEGRSAVAGRGVGEGRVALRSAVGEGS